MAKYALFPSKYVRNMSKNEGKTPREFMNGKTVSYKKPGYDKRRMDKYGSGFYDDLLITRSDGSRFLMHEGKSEVDGYELFEISEINDKNEVDYTVVVYSDEDLDAGRMQNDEIYLNAVADMLLSKKRIETKRAQQNEQTNGYIYVGTVREQRPGFFRKEAYAFENVEKQINTKLKELAEQRTEELKRQKMLDAIKEKLDSLTDDKLEQVCTMLGISIENDR